MPSPIEAARCSSGQISSGNSRRPLALTGLLPIFWPVVPALLQMSGFPEQRAYRGNRESSAIAFAS